MTAAETDDLERFRDYLCVLAESQLPAVLRAKVDSSDIVQQTLLHALEAQHQFRGTSDAERAGWLRSILANVLWGTLRHFTRECRDLSREQSFAAVEHSSLRLEALLAGDDSSPSQKLQKHEQALGLARALLTLSADQRQAVMLKYWNDMTLAEIASQTGKSPEAVAGLLYRGLRQLRSEGLHI